MANARNATNAYTYNEYTEKPIGQVLTEMKDELRDFVVTRVQMLQGEMKEKTGALKIAVPAAIAGAVIGGVAFLLLSIALVALIAMTMSSTAYIWAISFGVVGVIYAIAAGALISYSMSTLKSRGVKPERTLRVLRQDQAWFQTQVRTKL